MRIVPTCARVTGPLVGPVVQAFGTNDHGRQPTCGRRAKQILYDFCLAPGHIPSDDDNRMLASVLVSTQFAIAFWKMVLGFNREGHLTQNRPARARRQGPFVLDRTTKRQHIRIEQR